MSFSGFHHYGYPTMKEGCQGFWESLLFVYYKKYGDKDYYWCDIENIIKETLCLIYFGEDDSTKDLHKGLYSISVNYITHYYNSYNDSLNIYNLNDLEKFIFNYCYNFLLEKKYTGDFSKYLTLLSEQLLQELHSFERRFCKYIKNNIISRKNKYIVNAVNLLAKLTGFSSEKILEENVANDYLKSKAKIVLTGDFNNHTSTNILNFNYTALFDILEVESPCVYSNVHGKLCNNACSGTCNYSSVIFGIDDTLIQSENLNSDLRLFSKTYRKMLVAGEPANILPPKDTKSLEIKFYGHSLSEADYSYFQSIFDYYDLYGNSNISLNFYYSKGYEQYDNIYALISAYGKSLNNKEQGKNLIHKLLLENRLKIIEID